MEKPLFQDSSTGAPRERRGGHVLGVRLSSSVSHILSREQADAAALCGFVPDPEWARVWLDGPFQEYPIGLCRACWDRLRDPVHRSRSRH